MEKPMNTRKLTLASGLIIAFFSLSSSISKAPLDNTASATKITRDKAAPCRYCFNYKVTSPTGKIFNLSKIFKTTNNEPTPYTDGKWYCNKDYNIVKQERDELLEKYKGWKIIAGAQYANCE